MTSQEAALDAKYGKEVDPPCFFEHGKGEAEGEGPHPRRGLHAQTRWNRQIEAANASYVKS